MRLLLLTHGFNSLTQRLFVELRERGHEVSVEFDVNDAVTIEAVAAFNPDLVVAPFLKRFIPEAVFAQRVCLVVHPGIVGDRGPSALDWAILNDEREWGVTVLQANEVMDGGDIWAAETFPMRAATKSSLYRNEVTEAATRAVLAAVERFAAGGYVPQPLEYGRPQVRGVARPACRQSDRAIDWERDSTAEVLRKIRSADGNPGLLDALAGRPLYLHDAHPEGTLTGEPGTLLARHETAVCRATGDGGVWIGHLRAPQGELPVKLPATHALGAAADGLPEAEPSGEQTWRDLRYEESDGVGYLHFPFHNGAMGTRQSQRLRAAYLRAARRNTRVLVLMGGPDFWSNGIHLNLIEAAASPADESWACINAIDDLAQAVIETPDKLTVSALQGNAGAGGVFLALAADRVWAREGVVLNPHYKGMGNLYGSEYWTYLLPRRVGPERTEIITQARLPVGTAEGLRLGLLDERFGASRDAFVAGVRERAAALAADPALPGLLAEKRRRRADDEAAKPLARYREEELARMRLNFYGFDPSYHVARYNFVRKVPKSRTPPTIALHRRASGSRPA